MLNTDRSSSANNNKFVSCFFPLFLFFLDSSFFLFLPFFSCIRVFCCIHTVLGGSKFSNSILTTAEKLPTGYPIVELNDGVDREVKKEKAGRKY